MTHPPQLEEESEELYAWDELDHVLGYCDCLPLHDWAYNPKAKIRELLSNKEREANGCPCLLVEPCSQGCTCANPVMSGGCMRCARYGSMGQRLEAAKRLSAAASSPSLGVNHKRGEDDV